MELALPRAVKTISTSRFEYEKCGNKSGGFLSLL